MAPDGKRFVYRSFSPQGSPGDGLKIMNLETKAVTTLTTGYDNFPLWSPRGDLIMFSRQSGGDYEIYTVKPDGSSVTRLTRAPETTRIKAGRPTARRSSLRHREWASRMRGSTPTHRSRTASCSSCAPTARACAN